MHRDFSLQLALLLEAGFPEKSALELAGDGTGNMVIAAKARRAMRHLSRGESLPRALSRFESDGQFSWRGVECLAACGMGPVLQIGPEYKFHENLTEAKIDELIDSLRLTTADKPQIN